MCGPPCGCGGQQPALSWRREEGCVLAAPATFAEERRVGAAHAGQRKRALGVWQAWGAQQCMDASLMCARAGGVCASSHGRGRLHAGTHSKTHLQQHHLDRAPGAAAAALLCCRCLGCGRKAARCMPARAAPTPLQVLQHHGRPPVAAAAAAAAVLQAAQRAQHLAGTKGGGGVHHESHVLCFQALPLFLQNQVSYSKPGPNEVVDGAEASLAASRLRGAPTSAEHHVAGRAAAGAVPRAGANVRSISAPSCVKRACMRRVHVRTLRPAPCERCALRTCLRRLMQLSTTMRTRARERTCNTPVVNPSAGIAPMCMRWSVHASPKPNPHTPSPPAAYMWACVTCLVL